MLIDPYCYKFLINHSSLINCKIILSFFNWFIILSSFPKYFILIFTKSLLSSRTKISSIKSIFFIFELKKTRLFFLFKSNFTFIKDGDLISIKFSDFTKFVISSFSKETTLFLELFSFKFFFKFKFLDINFPWIFAFK